jgi:SAM-dependent methyltransferase
MHPTALSNGKVFFDTYVAERGAATVIDLGSQDVNGSLRDVCPANAHYIGVDFAQAKNVDVVLTDPYALPFETGSVDIVVSSSCFEHSEMFWLVFNEILRVLKPNGLFYLNAPSNGAFHRYPVDCWRFYPDCGNALVSWAKRCGLSPALLESFTTRQHNDIWNDFVAVFVRDAEHAAEHPRRMLSSLHAFDNGFVSGAVEIANSNPFPEDIRNLVVISDAYTASQNKLADAEARLGAIETPVSDAASLPARAQHMPPL